MTRDWKRESAGYRGTLQSDSSASCCSTQTDYIEKRDTKALRVRYSERTASTGGVGERRMWQSPQKTRTYQRKKEGGKSSKKPLNEKPVRDQTKTSMRKGPQVCLKDMRNGLRIQIPLGVERSRLRERCSIQ